MSRFGHVLMIWGALSVASGLACAQGAVPGAPADAPPPSSAPESVPSAAPESPPPAPDSVPTVPPASDAAPEAPPSLRQRLFGDWFKPVEGLQESFRGQSVTLGAGYVQKFATFTKFRDVPKTHSQITDNGSFSPLLQYNSKEAYVWEYPFKVGRASFGYNFIATYSTFDLNRQFIDSPFIGSNLHSRIEGDYFAVAPFGFVRLGPLYSTREIYWKFGVGVGLAVMRYHGKIIAHTDDRDVVENVKNNGDSVSPYLTEVWELQIERWSLLFKGVQIAGGGSKETVTLEEYGLSLAYSIPF